MKTAKIAALIYGIAACLTFTDLKAIPDVTIGESTSTIPQELYPNLMFPSWREMEARPIRPYVGYTTGPGPGYETGYTTGGFFFTMPRPYRTELLHSFLNVQGHLLNQGKCAFNAGGGVRCIVPSMDRIFGMNAYYDNRRVNNTSFQQVGVGLEWLGECWDFRINGYLPVGKHKISKPTFSPPYVFRTNVKRALAGFDAEWGITIKHRSYCSPWGIYCGAGPYYYDCKCHKKLWGGRGRVVCLFYDFLSLEFDATYDPVFKQRYQGRAFFIFPFNLSNFICTAAWDRYEFPKVWKGLWSKALATPQRNDLIVIDEQRCTHRCTKCHKKSHMRL